MSIDFNVNIYDIIVWPLTKVVLTSGKLYLNKYLESEY